MSADSSDLVKLAATYINIKESRRSFRANCPFHNDNPGSLLISPKHNIFKCFACGKEGGPEEFLQGMVQLGLTK